MPSASGPLRPGPSLVRQHTRWLVAAFTGMAVLTLALLVALVIWPLARRSADDLAGLMVLSAQTWAELPPLARPAFEAELRTQHRLQVRADTLGPGVDEWHPPFLYLLESALATRLGAVRHLVRTLGDDGQTWYWAQVQAGGRTLVVGLPAQRMNSQPLLATLAVLLAGVALALVLAVRLARHVAAPLARLEQASTRLGQGERPDWLPEDGPAELANLSHRFNLMAVQVRDLLAARTMLLAGVSHDLRTPLARMRLTLELLRTQPSDALLDRLERDMIHMNQLIANVLDLARGVTQEPLARLDVATLLGALAREHARPDRPVPVRAVADTHMAADGGLATTDWPADGCQAMLPALSLRRALGNLLENAMRHGSAGPVELVCVRCVPGHGSLQLGVLDRGPGIPPDRMEAVFQPFLRLEPSRSPTTGGSGLGLAIVRQLADAHGWTVQLLPRPGGGLAAWLHIPGCLHLSQN